METAPPAAGNREDVCTWSSGRHVSDNRWFPVTGCWTGRSHHLPGERSLSIMRMTQRPPGGLLL